MILTTKLQEAVAEIHAQREALNQIEAQLQLMIAKLAGTPIASTAAPSVTASSPQIPASTPDAPRVRSRDRLDDIVDVLREAGKPLHITVIAEHLSGRSKATVDRREIEPGINRHIAKVKQRRIEKFGPSTFGLPEWRDPNPLRWTSNILGLTSLK